MALACPVCTATLALDTSTIEAGLPVTHGTLRCSGCGAQYPIRDGIADFLNAPQPTSIAQRTNEPAITAWAYERLWRPYALTLLSGERFPYRRELPLITTMADARAGGIVIDIGCSCGLYARAMTHARGATPGHVIGVDRSFAMLREAHRRAQAAGLRISYVRATAQQLPIAAEACSAAVVGGSLNEIGDLDACLAEIRRTLRPHGRFAAMSLLAAIGPLGITVQRAIVAGGLQFWRADELLARFVAHGLIPDRHETYGIVMFSGAHNM